jgi:hypothetical protein
MNLEFWKGFGVDRELFNGDIQFETRSDVLGDAKVFCEGLGTGHVMAVWIGALGGRNDGAHDGGRNGLGLGRWGWSRLLLLVRGRRVLVHDWRGRVGGAGLEGWVEMGIV